MIKNLYSVVGVMQFYRVSCNIVAENKEDAKRVFLERNPNDYIDIRIKLIHNNEMNKI